MEYSHLLPWLATSIAAIFAFIFLFYVRRRKNNKAFIHNHAKKAPVVPGALPFLGHLRLFTGPILPHKALGALADKYGPAFTIYLGSHQTLVVSGRELVKECFTTNDRLFSNRPRSKAVKYLTYDEASVGFAPYGPLWVEMRKVSKLNFLSNQRIQMQKQALASELNFCFKDVYQLWLKNKELPVMVDMTKWFEEMTLNVITRLICGKQNYGSKANSGESEAKRYKQVVEKAAHLTSTVVMSDMFPSLEWFDKFQGQEKVMKKVANEFDSILGSWVDEHRRKRLLRGNNEEEEEEQDFIDLSLAMMEETQLHGVDPDTFIKSMCLGMILGGGDTTPVALTWALSLLLNNPDIMKKAQEEIDQVIGKERKLDGSDISNLVYLQAVVKESMRLYQVGPLIERETTEDCKIGDFHVEAGTRLLVNIWKVQQDPCVWSNPTEFQPERFLSSKSDMDLKGQHFELIPFGSGRRMCPAVASALQMMHLVLAKLIHGFELGTPMNAKIDMTETSSITNNMATHLQVLLNPRLNANLYDF